MTEKKPLRKGHGRRQFIACRDRIKELISQGYDISMTYEALREEGLITMSYAGFYDLITQRKKKKRLPSAAGHDQQPLFPIAPPMEPALLPQEFLDQQIQQMISTQLKTQITPLWGQSGISPDDKAERRKAVQQSLQMGLKANEQFVSSSDSDSEFEKEKNRLV